MKNNTGLITMKIQMLNDKFRRTFEGGKVYFTQNVMLLPVEMRIELSNLVRNFNDFSEDNDPYKEHDFGSIKYFNTLYFWKINYYDSELKYGSNDPSNPEQTTRVLTIMESGEY